ncbi:DUF2505 domain-containing protein [uncultured Rothia sp.]|uniref:DUF2505 domain-containing protein n=1 Tax=uncultured Rothia sp. TaxID=316088 RepID=UPI003217E52A
MNIERAKAEDVEIIDKKDDEMAVNETTTVNATVDQVIEAFASEDFARFACEKLGIGFEDFTVAGDTSGPFTATTTRTISADRVPDIAKKFVSKGLKMTQEDVVSAPAEDGSRTIESDIKVSGMPVTATASQQLVPQGEQTVINVSGDVSCGIPLVGKKIATAAEPYVGKVTTRLGGYIEEWLQQK